MEKLGNILAKQKGPYLTKDKEPFVRFNASLKILREGFTQLPNLIIDDYKLDCQGKAILMALYRHAYGQNHCYPSIRLLAQEAGCKRDTVMRRLKTLNHMGYLLSEKTGKFNTYTLVLKVKKL